MALVKLEIEDNLYHKYKKMVKEKNQMLKGYNIRIFEQAIRQELHEEKGMEDNK